MTITNYTIKKSIGQGGMATVYLANHQLLQNQVAIKVLNQEYVRNENIRKRFLAEARNMASMSHPNIIKVTDLIDDGDTVAFVMEHIEGETLKEYLESKGKLSNDEIKTIFSQMLEAVSYVHDKKLVHRDIKPSNFMINSEGQVKLLDFGIAKNTDANSADYTQTGTTQNMGTPMYMSPEQIKSTKDVTLQSDIYSLGVVLWQMVMGKKPYDTNTSSTYELQNKIVTENLSLTNSKFDSIIEVATAKELNIRFNNCNELKSKLENLNNEGLDNTKSYSSEVSEKTIVNDSNEKTIIESAQKSNTPSKPQIEITQTQLKKRKISPIVYLFIGIILITIYGLTRPYKEQSITNTEANTTVDTIDALVSDTSISIDSLKHDSQKKEKSTNIKNKNILNLKSNSREILSRIELGPRSEALTHNEARKYCETLGSNWRMPNRKEMKAIYELKDSIGFVGYYYWTSELAGNGKAWYQYMGDGTQFAVPVEGTNFVWPVRRK